MGEHGYGKITSYHCAFVKFFLDGDFIILLFYVDDMSIVGQDVKKIDKLKTTLNESFAMKDLGPAKQILGMIISRDRTLGSLMYAMVSVNENKKDYLYCSMTE
ncbi:hypothetical protein RJ639_044528 [Escallonia herrerae]|uniref:Reverse transcriptase Ty1/copia-type domain-containing protein n=1 Tax=Escallonia herrerae TaxID=1293975 RepID=A0AA88WA92_9ASTE|nr:hypothetical protein RJ639_044528 [Escallonia herrerae]